MERAMGSSPKSNSTEADPRLPRGPGSVLMLIDDVRTFMRFRDHILSRIGGFTVQQTSSIEDALVRMRSSCDVVLVDPDLPEAAGRDVVHRIRMAAESVPIVLLVDGSDASMIDEALSLGFQDCLARDETDEYRVHQSIQNAILRHSKLRELKQARALEHHDATHDPLTLLSNRQAFVSGLAKSIALANRRSNQLAVLFFDLDGFKSVNDVFGHAVGDALLAEVGSRMRQVTRKSDLAARFGGDEFVVALHDVDSPRAVMRAAEQFTEAISAPIAVGDHEHQVGVSIGVALYPEDSMTADGLIRAADLAMYSAKQSADSGVRFYQDEMDQEVHDRFALVADVRTASRREEYFLEYQPQVEVDRGCLVGGEALLRWLHPERGRLAPSEFLSIAEDTGMIVDVGHWALNEACRTAATWGSDAGAPCIAVNVSHYQLLQGRFAADVQEALARSGLPPERLVVEMTESGIAVRGGSVRSELENLARLGVTIAVDRFGVGVGSLALLQLPFVRMLKVDRSLIRTVGTDDRSRQIVDTLISMAERLGLKAIAEGVETSEQVEALHALGCVCMQGFALGGPVSSEDFARYTTGGGERPWRAALEQARSSAATKPGS